jgi:hypothetical protein
VSCAELCSWIFADERPSQQALDTKRDLQRPSSNSAKSTDLASCKGESSRLLGVALGADLLSTSRIVLGYPPKDNDFSFSNNLNFKLYDLVKQYSMGKP